MAEAIGSNPVEDTWKLLRCTYKRQSLRLSSKCEDHFFKSSSNHTSQNMSFSYLMLSFFTCFQLIEGVEVCVICGPQPTLQDTETKYLDQYWRLAVDMLKSSRRSHPRNLPGDIVLDMGILGFLLVNRDERKCLSSVHPSGVMTGVDSQSNLTGCGMSIAKRKSILVSFYKSVVGTLFPPHELAASLTDEPSSELHSSLPHQAMETYMCSNDHKCYAIRNATHELYLLFAVDVPNYALGSVASNTLNVLTKGKLVWPGMDRWPDPSLCIHNLHDWLMTMVYYWDSIITRRRKSRPLRSESWNSSVFQGFVVVASFSWCLDEGKGKQSRKQESDLPQW